MKPTFTVPPMMMNRPMKKKMVDHSTSASTWCGSSSESRSRSAAPPMATVAGSKWNTPCSTKPRMVSPMMVPDLRKSGLSLMSAFSSMAMIRALSASLTCRRLAKTARQTSIQTIMVMMITGVR
ncbi:hypothetical protein NNJEOMEG_04033 [Fundidesulfovibrio magnetotacticus]|uniref:Uncharacterized protein n=1 Tax=Fundidesulfovibrio magnetotacticus TaxID=2730080 RepID=A0A6V8LUY5_9BACT|nr:hypothetical protein NNJEOMEG_04033 [Fundidesulfovibrio magnetotacticus]